MFCGFILFNGGKSFLPNPVRLHGPMNCAEIIIIDRISEQTDTAFLLLFKKEGGNPAFTLAYFARLLGKVKPARSSNQQTKGASR